MTAASPVTAADRERDRIAALREYGILARLPVQRLSVGDEVTLAGFTELAAQVCGVRSAVLNLIDDQHQFQLAAHGCEPMVTDRADSMCEITLRLGDQLVVADTSQDERFAANPWVTGELGRVRFYAASPLRAPGGHLVGTICVFDTEPRTLDEGQRAALRTLSVGVIDVLELRRRSDQLRQTVAELARSHRQLASFASQLSHNLKTPLTASLGFGELLQDHPAVRQDPTALDYVNRSVSASQRMMSAIDQLLSYASMGGAPQREPTPVHELVEQVLADLGPTAADAEVRCDRTTVTADPVQLRVLLHNLIENAVTYRNPDARCEVAVTVAPTRWGSELRVADNGPGIPAEQRPAVLRPLVRLESETAAGSGLGLATCERIVAAHGGTLSITDTAGGGATVCVRLPGTGATQS